MVEGRKNTSPKHNYHVSFYEYTEPVPLCQYQYHCQCQYQYPCQCQYNYCCYYYYYYYYYSCYYATTTTAHDDDSYFHTTIAIMGSAQSSKS